MQLNEALTVLSEARIGHVNNIIKTAMGERRPAAEAIKAALDRVGLTADAIKKQGIRWDEQSAKEFFNLLQQDKVKAAINSDPELKAGFHQIIDMLKDAGLSSDIIPAVLPI